MFAGSECGIRCSRFPSGSGGLLVLYSQDSTETMDLSIIIVNWNSVGFLAQCISSIYSQTYNLEFEVLVVDNASYDGSTELIDDVFQQVRFIQARENLGFGKAKAFPFYSCSGRN